MQSIGLTGGIATGKSSVADLLKRMDVPVLNADEVAHRALETGTDTFMLVIQSFGKDILDFNGEIDRRKLGRIVFNNPEARHRLEAIIHPTVIREIQTRLKQAVDGCIKLMAVEVPLLFEAGMEDQFDYIWVVSAPTHAQLKRLQERDGLSKVEAQARVDSQWPLALKEAKADAVIQNSGNLQDLEIQVSKLLQNLGWTVGAGNRN